MNVHQKPWAGILLEVDLSVRPGSYYYYYYYYIQTVYVEMYFRASTLLSLSLIELYNQSIHLCLPVKKYMFENYC